MTTDMVPAPVPGPDRPPSAGPSAGPVTSMLASLVAPVDPARPTFDITPPAGATAATGEAGDTAIPGGSSSAYHGDNDASATTDTTTNGRIDKRAIWRAWFLAGADRWRKGGGALNKRLDVAKAKAQSHQVKEARTVTVNRTGGLPVRNSAATGPGGKSLNSKGNHGSSGTGSGKGSGKTNGSGHGPAGHSGHGGRSGHGGSGHGRDGGGGGRGSSGGSGGSRGGGGQAGGGGSSKDSAKDAKDHSPKGGGSGTSGGSSGNDGSRGTAGKDGKGGSAGSSGGSSSGSSAGDSTKPSGSGGGSSAGPATGKDAAGRDGKSGKDNHGSSSSGSRGSAGALGASGKDGNSGSGGAAGGGASGRSGHSRSGGHAAKSPIQKTREFGYEDGALVAGAVAHVKAYGAGVKDGWTDRSEIAKREKARLGKAHADRKKQLDNERAQREKEKTVDGSSADYHKPEPIPATVGGDTVQLGKGADRTSLTRGEVRSLKAYERLLTEKESRLVKRAEMTKALKDHAEQQAKNVTKLMEKARASQAGDKVLATLLTVEQNAKAQVAKAEDLHTRATRGAEKCTTLRTNVETRYGDMYKAVVNSPETSPAEASYYLGDSSA